MRAGRRAFAHKGLAGTKLNHDILEPAGVSVGSFYHQFKDKTDLMIALFEENADNIRSQVHEVYRRGAGRSLREVARDGYDILFEMADKYSESMRIALSERGLDEPRLRRTIEEDRRRWTETLERSYMLLTRARHADLDVELAVELTGAMMRGILDYYLELPVSARPAGWAERHRRVDPRSVRPARDARQRSQGRRSVVPWDGCKSPVS